MFDKMKQLMELQKKAKEMQKALEAERVEKASRDGRVRVVVNGAQKVESVSIDESLLSPAQKSLLEQELARVLSEAAEEVRGKAAAQAMGMMKGLGI